MLRVAFQGRGGIGSEGNADGQRMREAIREALAAGVAVGLVIDLISFEYHFGDWIGAVPLAAVKLLGAGRVCLVADGETAAGLRSLWEASRLGRVVPIFGELPEALQYLSVSGVG